MSDVSSCVITVSPGQHVAKAEQLGYFQSGGSTHCLVCEPDAIDSFTVEATPQPGGGGKHVVNVHSHIATARRR